MKNRLSAAAAAAALVFTLPMLAHAQQFLLPEASLTTDDPSGTGSALSDAYAAAADTWDKWLFVGAPREEAFRDGFEIQDGAVYIYEHVDGDYVFSQKLTMPGSSDVIFPLGDRYGGGIEASNGWLFVGSANDQDFPGLVDPRAGLGGPDEPPFLFAGQVHIYRLMHGSWEYVQTLISPEPGTFGSFGARSQASHIALNSKGNVAVIGELNAYPDGVGQLHTYRRTGSTWNHVQSIPAPLGINSFGDDQDFASDKWLIAGAGAESDDQSTSQGFLLVYKAKGKSGRFEAEPTQIIAGPVNSIADCPNARNGGFGRSGLDASQDTVAVADPCFNGEAGPLTGAINFYYIGRGRSPLKFYQTIEGDEPNLSLGANIFTSRNTVAVSEDGHRVMVGAPLSPVGSFSGGAIGGDVRVYYCDGEDWGLESRLISPTPPSAIFRAFGDAVFFTDNETALVREGNFIDPVVEGLKGQGLIYDLTP
ncbi:MAG: hypothetical protein QNI99_18100 [Woeseiaceae bacterium]|nr:hypothetical protein [Woeseiaceae bacterium]